MNGSRFMLHSVVFFEISKTKRKVGSFEMHKFE